MLEKKRDKMAKFLSEVGMAPVIPDGGYFMIADFSALGKLLFNALSKKIKKHGKKKDLSFCLDY